MAAKATAAARAAQEVMRDGVSGEDEGRDMQRRLLLAGFGGDGADGEEGEGGFGGG
jgi:hypothetical protein